MKSLLVKNIVRSILFHRRDAVNQFIVVALLTAIITGCLFTGDSVRTSLKRKALEKLGNSDFIISSGIRYFNSSLAKKISDKTKENTIALLEADGYCQNFITGITALSTKIYGIGKDFFPFQGNDSLFIQPGTVLINQSLAHLLGINAGEEIIVRFRSIDPIPSNAPFAPSADMTGSRVLKVTRILMPNESGNFSLGISQIVPMNVFMNISDLSGGKSDSVKVNRLLIQNRKKNTETFYYSALSAVLSPKDIGLSLRVSAKTGEPELISDRIFIDSGIVNFVLRKVPSSYPLITYLGNTLTVNNLTTPYSFIAAVPSSFISDLTGYEIIISKWLAEDLKASERDSLKLSWFNPGPGRVLEEREHSFIIKGIIENDSRYSDPSLMPDFPGISGSATCSEWDAGIPVFLDRIRKKDEDYWNKYRGTPKAFISYETGLRLWGNNFGVATALRFPERMTTSGINEKLTGSIDPRIAGFSVTDIKLASIRAASEGVDFTTLFLGLGIFIIVSCIILLALAVSMFLDSRKSQVRTYFALGFRNRQIKSILFLETFLISVSGALPGVFLGYFINALLIKALNTVWTGAVQTETLSSSFSLFPILTGFVVTIIISIVLFYFKIRGFLKKLNLAGKENTARPSSQRNLLMLFASAFGAAAAETVLLLFNKNSIYLSFTCGLFIFLAFILLLRQYYLSQGILPGTVKHGRFSLSGKYYSFNSSHAIMPVILIAAGIFAVIITGANRQVVDKKMLLPPSGTGGYLLWAESAIPVKQNLNTAAGKKEFGLEENGLKELEFVQMKRLPGNDASCLNLNHVSAPAILGVDAPSFIRKGSFSFASGIMKESGKNPWELLNENPGENTIYGMADQTVLEWGLKLKTGDTLKYRAENGRLLNIVICAGLKSSVFQGYLLIGQENFERCFPSVGGSSVFLIDGKSESSELYRQELSDRLSGYGVFIEPAVQKLATFFRVTNTYIDVFTILGALGMLLGVAGLGIVLLRNFNYRKREFALMMATGFSTTRIRWIVLTDEILILTWGIITGTVSALAATLPSLKGGTDFPWGIIITMILAMFLTGIIALRISVTRISGGSLVDQLRKE